MRPGQNKRMRGRSNNNNNNNNRKGPNPLTRSYESNGPDVKIRGTAHHIGEKYLQLARDAQSSGDPVMAESYLQHAEHYFRIIATAQQAQQQAQAGYQRQPGEQIEMEEEDGDEDFASLPDRFASPSERQPPQPPQNVPQPYGGQPFSDRQPYDQRPERPYDNRQGNQQGGDRQQGDRPPYENRDRQYDNRRDRNGQDRGNQGNPDRGQQDRQDRGSQDRQNQERQDRAPDGGPRNNGQGQGDRPPRDYDNRNFRSNRNREFRDQSRPPVHDEQPGLPAFITAPTRVVPENEPQPSVPETHAVAGEDDPNFHLRPRRRRRPKAELEGGEAHSETPATDPVGD